jgi:hypothetical protein
MLRQLKIQCYDWDSNSDPDLIGEFVTTLQDLTGGSASFALVIHRFIINLRRCFYTTINVCTIQINPKKKAKKKSYQNSGMLQVKSAKLDKAYSFLEYIRSGYQLNLMGKKGGK